MSFYSAIFFSVFLFSTSLEGMKKSNKNSESFKEEKEVSSYVACSVEKLLTPLNKAKMREELEKLETFFKQYYAQGNDFNTLCLTHYTTGHAGKTDLKNFPTLSQFLTTLLNVVCQKAGIAQQPVVLLDQGYRCSSTHGHETKKDSDTIALGCQTLRTFLLDCPLEQEERSFKSFVFLLAHECGHLHSDKDRAFNCASQGPDGAEKARCLRAFELAADQFGATLCSKIMPHFTHEDACYGLDLIGKIIAESLKKELKDQEIINFLNDDKKLVNAALDRMRPPHQKEYKHLCGKKREALDLALQIQCADKPTYTHNCEEDEKLAHQLKNHYPTTFVRSKKIARILHDHRIAQTA